MKVVLAGGSGQLGQQLLARVPAGVELSAPGRNELDIQSQRNVIAYCRSAQPDLIINAAAYTAVDAAESEPEKAHGANAAGAESLAIAAAEVGARMLHVSTDFVFDGQTSRPYPPDASTGPLSVYGRSKLAGEQLVTAVLASQVSIVRTAWVYGPRRPNFVRTMIRLLLSREELGVVDDQIGSPTSASGLAAAIWRATSLDALPAIWHWTDSGVASWYDFAEAVRELSAQRWPGRLWGALRPITSLQYKTAAQRPSYSVLSKEQSYPLVGTPEHWRTALAHELNGGDDGDWLPQ